jgi:hypothetical protein
MTSTGCLLLQMAMGVMRIKQPLERESWLFCRAALA